MSKMTIIVFFALLNNALGTIGYGAKNSHTKNAMLRKMPRISGARLCALPHGYFWLLATDYVEDDSISIPETRPTANPS
jgi:hypothetical protein